MDTYKIDWLKIAKRLSPYNIKKGLLYMKHFGPKEFWIRLTERFQADDVDYEEWYKNHKPTMEELQRQRDTEFEYEPLISILVPVYNTPEEFLKQMIQSVRKQTYDNWELCIANANPANETVAEILRISSTKDERIKVKDVPENEGIAQNTNAALAIATGDYIGLLDHDDLLTPDALYEVVKMINENDRPQVLYSDEDKITMDLSEHFQPHMKPDYNKDLLRSNNYITHFFVAERMLVEEVGGEDGEYNGAQDYDLILKCTERAKGIAHIPRILYHWRVHKASTADNPASKMYAFDAGKRAIEDHLKRCGEIGKVSHEKDLGFYRVKYQVQGSPLISIIIPNKDQVESLDKCLRSIEKSSYKNYEIIIVENNSTEDETFAYYKKIESDKIRIVYWSDEFNYSAINNFGVKHARGDYLLLLNNDVEVITTDWLEELTANCQRKDVGIVGARLYYPDDTIQHAGIVIGIGGVAGALFVGMPRMFTGYLHKASIQQDLSAVTAACMMVKRSVYEELGGLEEELKVAFNDVDFCLRAREKGYLVVYDPNVELYHFESKSRGTEDSKEKIRRFQNEIEYMRSHWLELLKKGDPMYNPNLTLTKWDYSLRNNQKE
ncbi:glycosyltransferase family 2 protein [Dorea sp. AF36-15AT]|uniref:glycosyltransferase family 2 protein n=1 Tax=Dorea sp. AF36-15AT TaxID=2292041 RepID=UPI000E4C7109|nr:glycosyltransferase family 2 protein [Dorea sp. AF36-15AT]RHP10570.1 glycosyltransferase family 2 protein [Dorea sp. AF36-15AT]